MNKFDAIVVGAGLAGLQCARTLARNGASVLITDIKKDPSQGVRTSGIFVRKTFEDFRFKAGCLGTPISRVRVYSPALRMIELDCLQPEFRIGDMRKIYNSFLGDCMDEGAEFLGGARFVGSRPEEGTRGGSVVSIRTGGTCMNVRAGVLIGADGTASSVARDLGLDLNEKWIVGREEVFKGPSSEREPTLHCFFNARLAPGYIAWIADDGEECHIGVGGYPDRFDPNTAFAEFRENIVPGVLDLNEFDKTETRGGRIPVGGVLRRIGCSRGLLVGDAAGAVSPLTAGGLDPCMRLSEYAAELVLESFTKGDPEVLAGYSGKMFRAKFLPRLMMRFLYGQVRYQKQFELVFRALETGAGRAFAEKIFYRRASFPDIEGVQAASRAMRRRAETGK